MYETIDVRIKNLEDILKAIRTCTQPVDGHPDPKSIEDCWAAADDQIARIKSVSKANIFTTWTEAMQRSRGEGSIRNYDELQVALGTVNFQYRKEDNP